MDIPSFPDPNSEERWRAADHLGVVHLFHCTGESRTIQAEFGEKTGAVIETVVTFSKQGEPLSRFDDVLVLQSVLARQCKQPGFYLGGLARPEQAYQMVPLGGQMHSKLATWVRANVKDGRVVWYPTMNGGTTRNFPHPDEAPF